MRDYTKKIRSPYAKYRKRPYRYSDVYYAWKAVATTNPDRALELSIEHARKFDYPAPVPTDPRDWV